MNDHMKIKSAAAYRSSRGFTLLELLIYMVIATLIMSAGIVLFKSAATQRNTLSSAAELRQESFLASRILTQQFAQIGYRQVDNTLVTGRAMPLATKQSAYPAVEDNWIAGQVIKGSAISLVYRYQGASSEDLTPDETIFDCLGNPVSAGVIRDTQLIFQDNQLHCTTNGQTTVLLGVNDSVDVERVMFVLGVDDNNDGAVDRQVPSSTSTDTDFTNTRQLTVRLLLTSDDQVGSDVRPYRFNNQMLTPTDRKLRVETEVTVALRN